MIYFCDYTPTAVESMKETTMTNDDVQRIFNLGISDGQFKKFLDWEGHRMGIHFQYDAYSLRHVIISVYKRPLVSKYAKSVEAKNKR